jgi:hypothetical protein
MPRPRRTRDDTDLLMAPPFMFKGGDGTKGMCHRSIVAEEARQAAGSDRDLPSTPPIAHPIEEG